MRDLFRSGAAFLIVAAICFMASALILVKGLVTDNGSMGIAVTFLGNAVVWFIIAIAVRRKNIAKHKPDTES